MKRILSKLVGLVAGLTCTSAALAQDISPVFDIGVLTNTLTIPTEVQGSGRSAGPVYQGRSYGGGAVDAMKGAFNGRPAAGSAVRLNYTATPALKREALDGYVSRIARQNPDAAKQVAAQFARHDAGRIYRGLSTPFGLRDNDAADVLTGYTVLGWLIATGAPDPSPSAVRAARGQIAAGLAANPQLSAPATRAQLGEELKLLFVTLHSGWQSARREGNLKAYSDGVAQMFRAQSGRDLRAVKLTEAGFSRR